MYKDDTNRLMPCGVCFVYLLFLQFQYSLALAPTIDQVEFTSIIVYTGPLLHGLSAGRDQM